MYIFQYFKWTNALFIILYIILCIYTSTHLITSNIFTITTDKTHSTIYFKQQQETGLLFF